MQYQVLKTDKNLQYKDINESNILVMAKINTMIKS